MKLSNLSIKKYLVLLILLFILAFSGYFYSFNHNNRPTLIVDNHKINLEVVNNESSRERGLSGRSGLGNKQGMLFVFKQSSQQYFWNQDMEFSIDVVWINQNKVIGVDSLPVDTGENITVSSPGKVDRVLELKSGQAKELDLTLNQKISLENIPNAN